MLQYATKRVLLFIPVIIGVLLGTFLVLRLVPGDPALAYLGLDATPEERVRITHVLGLDRPLLVQFVLYVSRTAQGDLGRSIFLGDEVSRLLAQALPVTLELAVLALLITIAVALPVGVFAAVRANTAADLWVTVAALIGISMPLFWFAILAIQLFALELGWLPSFGRGPGLFSSLAALFAGGSLGQVAQALRHDLLPALTLALGPIAIVTRLTRASVLEVLGLDYVRTARAKGLSQRVVVYRHALRNALLPIVTIVGLQFGTLLGGAVITETIFAWPGLGRLVVNAISQRDYPVVQGGVILVAILVCTINLLVDLMYAWINPRIRYA